MKWNILNNLNTKIAVQKLVTFYLQKFLYKNLTPLVGF